jgi:penicillin-binding protein 2
MFQHRVQWALGFMGVLLFVLIGRLAYLQILNHEHFTTLSHENRLKIVPIAPPRGSIFSREGTALAENRPSFSLTVIPENAANLDASVLELGNLLELSDEELDTFSKQLERARRFENVTLKSDLDPEDLAVFSVNRFRFPGFRIEAGVARHYPLAEKTAHAIGYVGRISETDLESIDETNYSATTHIGKTGVERAREDVLHGQVGYQRVEVNAQGRILRIVERTAPVAGKDIYLTLDSSLQEEAIKALDGRRGAVVAIDPASGGILAFVSEPSFDPNEFVNGVSRSLYRTWSTSADRPLFNRALQGQYPPGSTIKPFAAIAGLQHGVRSPDQKTWCSGWYSLPGDEHRYRDWLKRGHGHVDLKQSIARSCDVYYYNLAHDLGIERLHRTLSVIGFGSITGVDIPGEAAGLLPSPEWKKRTRNLPWYPGETLIAGIGQGFVLTTPIQLAYVTSIIANRGEVSIPHFVAQIEDPIDDTSVSPDIYHRPRIELGSETYWDNVIDGMIEVVNGPAGTARRSGDGAAVRFAGKTGTSQVFGIAQDEEVDNDELPEHLKDHALFIAYAPLDVPEIAIAVLVENGGSGSRTAAPIARQLIDHYFRPTAENVAPSNG